MRSYIKIRALWLFIIDSEAQLENCCPPSSAHSPTSWKHRGFLIGWMVITIYRAAGKKYMSWSRRGHWMVLFKFQTPVPERAKGFTMFQSMAVVLLWQTLGSCLCWNWFLIWVHKVTNSVIHTNPPCLHFYLFLWVRLPLGCAHGYANIEWGPF